MPVLLRGSQFRCRNVAERLVSVTQCRMLFEVTTALLYSQFCVFHEVIKGQYCSLRGCITREGVHNKWYCAISYSTFKL